MDKNTIIGFILIAAIIFGFAALNKPSEAEIAKRKRYNDSIAMVQQQQAAMQQKIDSTKQYLANADSTVLNDSAAIAQKSDAFGAFSPSAFGEQKFITVENKLIKLKFSNKGGRIYSAELKNYRTHDSLPLILFDKEESTFGFTLTTNNNRVVNTSDLYFDQIGDIVKDKNGNQSVVLRLKTSQPASYIDFIYTIPANDYMVKYDVKASNMNAIIPPSMNLLEMNWTSKIRQQEKGRQFEERYSALHFKYLADDMEKLSESKNDQEEVNNKVKWIAFKDQFFSSILIADESFVSTMFNSEMMPEKSGFLKSFSSKMSVGFDPTGNQPTGFRFYFGPNQYKILSAYDKGIPGDQKLELRDLIPLGWTIFGWVNRYMIIPMFNFFSTFIGSFGLIILLMTIVIKILIFPMTYKSYVSSAKMRVLKPEIDEINARIPAEKALERQKATMDLYNKVGVSPMSGCLPMLLQMPILFAMFSFFPSAIELRQQSFLWAKDLSAYDAILSWNAYIPLITPFFGNHISLFCLLMTISSIISTKLTTAQTPTASDQPGAGMMKWMMYLMPVMFMFMFNNYASGLSYYYFLSTLITIGQTYLIRATVDDKKLLAQLHAKGNKAKPKKKSGFMERLEKMQREQEKALKNRK
ncbi:MAG TPA: membrane protein insertase YidC [Paludibacteraceae bacterium]|nr:membrane protein insertase YidC [Paludibacteraceae bacterium]